MDELMIETNAPVSFEILPANQPVQRKRQSGYARMKRRALLAEQGEARADDLAKDVTALEGLVERLLNRLDRAARIDMTDQDRERIIRMVNDIRGHLATKESG